MKKIILLSCLSLPITTIAQNTFPTTGNVGIGTSSPQTTLAVNGSLGITCGVTSAMARPAINSGTIQGEIRGISGGGWNAGDDGFLRLSAGGGTNSNTKSFIDLSGYTNNVSERYMNITMGTSGSERFRITYDGRIGIGTTNPQAKLAVNGDIYARKVKVTQSGWPDYVFDENYKLLSLAEVAAYVKEHKHLPDMPPADIVEKEGLDVGEMNKQLLKKIEELTLYIIQLKNKQDETLQRIERIEKEKEELRTSPEN